LKRLGACYRAQGYLSAQNYGQRDVRALRHPQLRGVSFRHVRVPRHHYARALCRLKDRDLDPRYVGAQRHVRALGGHCRVCAPSHHRV
jgi:hypothetical protein